VTLPSWQACRPWGYGIAWGAPLGLVAGSLRAPGPPRLAAAARGVGSGRPCRRDGQEAGMRIEPVERDQAPPVVQRIYDAIE
jgi:hypothetical protein